MPDYEYLYEREQQARDRAEADWHAAVEQGEAERARVEEREAALADRVAELEHERDALRKALSVLKERESTEHNCAYVGGWNDAVAIVQQALAAVEQK